MSAEKARRMPRKQLQKYALDIGVEPSKALGRTKDELFLIINKELMNIRSKIRKA